MKKLLALFGIVRLPFLLLTPMCVLLGLGMAVHAGKPVNIGYVLLALVGALCAHASVNSFNEYFDFKSGLDAETKKTPFSGGSGTLPANPALARTALVVAWVSFAVTVFIGFYFCLVWGFAILPLGVLGLILVVAYTPWFTRNPFICLVAPGLGFGILMVTCVYFAITGEYSLPVLLASLVPFFLVNNLLLLNQFPDTEADRRVGRKHLPIVAGRKASSIIYVFFLFCTYLVIAIGVAIGFFSGWSLLGLVTIVLAVPAAIQVVRFTDSIEQLFPSLGLNVLVNILTPLLMGLGLLIG